MGREIGDTPHVTNKTATPVEPMERVILMILAVKETVAAVQFESIAPLSMYTPPQTVALLQKMTESGLIERIKANVSTNGTTLYVPTATGLVLGHQVIEEEIQGGFPSAKVLFAGSLLDAFPSLRAGFNEDRLVRVAKKNPRAIVEALRP